MDGGQAQKTVLSAQTSLRDGTWGDTVDREYVARLASDIAARAGFGVCVLEVARVDAAVECIALHDVAADDDQYVGRVRPLADVEPSTPASTHGDLAFFAAGSGGRTRRTKRSGSGAWVPGPRPHADADAWQHGDVLVARLKDEQNTLRALVQLDRPLDGRRRREADLKILSDDLQVTFQALLVCIDRELLVQHVRLGRAVRQVLRKADKDLAAKDLINLVRWQMREGFRADELYIALLDADDFPSAQDHSLSTDLFTGLMASTRRAWAQDDVVILEPGRVWGDEALRARHAAELDQLFVQRQISTIVQVPIGDNALLLGAFTIVRFQGGPRWTDSESAAALEAGRDLGHAILNARAAEREHVLNDELKRLSDHRTELIATLSHELNNPTGVILGHLELLAARHDLDPLIQRSLAAIERSARRIAALSEDLLVLRVLEDPNHPLDRHPVDLVGVVREAVDLAQLAAAQATVILQMVAPGGEVTVMGDRDELTQTVTNLVSNAIKYTDPGGNVCLAVVRTKGRVELSCTDDGIGISAEDMTHLFREFFRSTNTNALKRPGNGLGLAIVQRIVARHHGTIEVESGPGKGTAFRITLPASE